jgi:hypothetical protein
MQNVKTVSNLKFHIISNGVSLTLCTGKWINLFTENVLMYPIEFSAYKSKLVVTLFFVGDMTCYGVEIGIGWD